MTTTFWPFYVGKMAIKPTFYEEVEMRNRDWLNKMALIDLLNIINERFEGCFVYRIEEQDFNSIDGRCEKYNWDCQKCIAAWLNEEKIF